MASETTARKVLWPQDSKILMRVCFLYVGQGSSILVLVRDGKNYKALLVDTNLDEPAGGIDIPALIKDLLGDEKLHCFVNTHPHDDHLHGLKELKKAVTIENVWHSGHIPSKKYGNYHPDLTTLVKEVESAGGEAIEIDGSKSARKLFDAEVYFLAPAEHVKDEVNEEEADARYQRIHENCAVLRFGKDSTWILVTGDADLVAFRDHITNFHKERLPAYVLDASHHGSRSFFKAKEDDDAYLDALEAIDPTYVLISAPTQEESRHDHPHDDALKLYQDYVGEENVFHTGGERESFIIDLFEDGTGGAPKSDDGELSKEYGLDKETDGSKGGTEKAEGRFVPPSAPAIVQPRKFA